MAKALSPMLAPNEIPTPDQMKFPLLGSLKLDGMRCIVHDGTLYSRTWKPIPNPMLLELLKDILQFSKDEHFVYDGELYSPKCNFQEVIGALRRSYGDLPAGTAYFMFDHMTVTQWDKGNAPLYQARYDELVQHKFPGTVVLKQTLYSSWEEVEPAFNAIVESGGEGMILRSPKGVYKHGRCTIRENNMFKMKLFDEQDAKIVGVEQGTENIGERVLNAFGRHETTAKKDDRKLIEALGAFVVVNEAGVEFSIGSGYTALQRAEYWKNRKKLIGTWLKYKSVTVGVKDKPRFPVFLGFRDDK